MCKRYIEEVKIFDVYIVCYILKVLYTYHIQVPYTYHPKVT